MRRHTASGGKKMASTISTALEAAFSVAMILVLGYGFSVVLDGDTDEILMQDRRKGTRFLWEFTYYQLFISARYCF
jgi:hypothetical protein